MKHEGKYSAPAVESAVRILKYLASYRHDNATLTEISSALGISRATCLRILHTLVDGSMLNFEEGTKRYSLGPFLVALGTRAGDQIDYLSIAQTYLKTAAEMTGFTCVLNSVVDRDWIAPIARQEVPSPVAVSVAIGQKYPITAGSYGKCFLAFLSEDEARSAISRMRLRAFTPHSIVREDFYMEELRKVRRQGFALSVEEHFCGINGISVPIFGHSGKVVLTMTCIGTSLTLKEQVLWDCARIIRDLAEEVSRRTAGNQR